MRAAVLGSPIAHSQSPQLHLAAYDHLGVQMSYSRIEVTQQSISEFIADQAREPGWRGWSCTMPLKSIMLEHMDSISERVKRLGVLNTVVHSQRNGEVHLHGENTDVYGVVTALTEAGLSRPESSSPREKPFGLIGAGGTAAASLAAAAELGYSCVVAYVRSFQRAATLEPVADALGLSLLMRPLEALHTDFAQGRTVEAMVSTLPPGAADQLADELPAVPRGTLLLDAAYDPWPSAIASSWVHSGGQVVSGLQMLLHQAVKQVELYTAETEHPAAQQSEAQHAQMVDRMRAVLS